MDTRSLSPLCSSRRWLRRRARWPPRSSPLAGGNTALWLRWPARRSVAGHRLTVPMNRVLSPYWGTCAQGFTWVYCKAESRFTEAYFLSLPQVLRAVALAVCSLILAIPAQSAVTIVGSGNIAVTADTSGVYSVTVPDLAWSFSGSIGVPLSNLQ